MYEVWFTKQAEKDKKLLKQAGLEKKVKRLIDILEADPYQYPPGIEPLTGNLQGLFSRRINLQHRLVYKVYEEEKIVKILSMWTHYQNL